MVSTYIMHLRTSSLRVLALNLRLHDNPFSFSVDYFYSLFVLRQSRSLFDLRVSGPVPIITQTLKMPLRRVTSLKVERLQKNHSSPSLLRGLRCLSIRTSLRYRAAHETGLVEKRHGSYSFRS